jgi:hypothetical protein
VNQQHVSRSRTFVSDVASFDIGTPCLDLLFLHAAEEVEPQPLEFRDQEYVLFPRTAGDEEDEEDWEDDEDEDDEDEEDDWEDDEEDDDWDEDDDEDDEDWEDDEEDDAEDDEED